MGRWGSYLACREELPEGRVPEGSGDVRMQVRFARQGRCSVWFRGWFILRFQHTASPPRPPVSLFPTSYSPVECSCCPVFLSVLSLRLLG